LTWADISILKAAEDATKEKYPRMKVGKSGVKHVVRFEKMNQWVVQWYVKGRLVNISRFKSLNDARDLAACLEDRINRFDCNQLCLDIDTMKKNELN
jgi:hypothetical protein